MPAKRTLIELISSSTPELTAFAAPGRTPLTFRALSEQLDRTVSDLNGLGLGRGDPIAIVVPNGPAMATLFLGVASGAVAAPLNPAYTAAEFDFYLRDIEAKALIVMAGSISPAINMAEQRDIPVIELVEAANECAGLFALRSKPTGKTCRPGPAEPQDIALLLHTSGTTSRPKMVPLTQSNLVASAISIGRTLALGSEDRCLNIMPLFHIHGLVGGLLAPLAAGGSIIVPPCFNASGFFDWLDELAPTWYTAVPTMHQAILAQAPQAQKVIARRPLRFIRSSSASLPPPVMEALESVFHAPVIESYGMTEAAHQMTSNPLPPAIRKRGTVGVPAGPEVAVMATDGTLLAQGQAGEVVIRGTNVTLGYLRNPEANALAFSNGWFHTGDVGFFDGDGYLTISGRLKEIINRGGEKVTPLEIDAVLLSHRAVAEALAFAIPHRTLGEEVAAAVVLRSGTEVSESELRAYASQHLASFKVPRKIIFLRSLPKGATGKPQRIGLAKQLGLAREREENSDTAPGSQTALEAAVAGLWCHILKVPHIGREEDFFISGGDSLQATRLILEVRQIFGVMLSAEVMTGPASTIAGMAQEIEKRRSSAISGQAALKTDENDGRFDVDFAEFEPPRNAKDKTEVFYVDPRTGLRRARPNTRYSRIVINNQGYRGPAITLDKPPGTVRLAFLGSSGTYDPFASGNNATWPHLTCDNLKATFPEARIDYLNGSLPGFNTRHLTVLFKEYLTDFEPDAAVIWANDLNGDTAYFARSKGIYKGGHYQLSALDKRFRFWAKIRKNLTIVARLIKAQSRKGKLSIPSSELTKEFEERLEQLVLLCQDQCSIVVLATPAGRLRRSQSRLARTRSAVTNVFFMPYMSIEGLVDAYEAYAAAVRRVGERTGALVIDAAKLVPGDGVHFVDSGHFQDVGSKLMAAGVSAALSQDPRFRALIAGSVDRLSLVPVALFAPGEAQTAESSGIA